MDKVGDCEVDGHLGVLGHDEEEVGLAVASLVQSNLEFSGDSRAGKSSISNQSGGIGDLEEEGF